MKIKSELSRSSFVSEVYSGNDQWAIYRIIIEFQMLWSISKQGSMDLKQRVIEEIYGPIYSCQASTNEQIT